MELTQERLKSLLSYNPTTGVFTRIKARGRCAAGAAAGTTDEDGYVTIGVGGKKYAAGRLAFFWMTGKWPSGDCDHGDGDPPNNRWGNLRDATTSQNLQNKRMQSNNKCGLKGVVRLKRNDGSPGKWRARIKVAERQIHLGLFDTPHAAHRAYVTAAKANFGVFARAS